MRRISAVGFDLGETLLTYAEAPLNWASLYRPALVQVAKALEFTPTNDQFFRAEAVLAFYNTRLNPRIQEVDAEAIFTEALVSWGNLGSVQRSRAIEIFFGFFRQSLRVYEDTLATLELLRSRGVPTGILTDVPYGMPRRFVEQDLAVTGIVSSIDLLLTSVEVGRRKPAPEGFHRLASALRVAPAEMIYIGNEPKDIAGAQAAGLISVLIDREKSGTRVGQSLTIHSLGAIFAWLDSDRGVGD